MSEDEPPDEKSGVTDSLYSCCHSPEEAKLVTELLNIPGKGGGSVLEEMDKAHTVGESCEYAGANSDLVCPGGDLDCRYSKAQACELRKGFLRHGGGIGYFAYQIRMLKNEGKEVSSLVRMLKEVYSLAKEKYFFEANCKFKTLKAAVEKEFSILEKEAKEVREPVLFS